MIRIDRPTDCCGCEACAQRCPKQCIAMHADAEGFLYPRINTAACIDCGLCEQVCPVLRPAAPRTPTAVYAAKNPDERIRMESSSGGVFTLLAERTIRAGGVVFGARFDEAWEVVHDSTETIEGLAAFRGSKYVQSRIGTSFARAEEFLKQGRQVLFTGTPCQIAGLNRFLRRSYDNLLTVDVVCHGVPSPLVWRRYLDEIGGGGDLAHLDAGQIDRMDEFPHPCFRHRPGSGQCYGRRRSLHERFSGKPVPPTHLPRLPGEERPQLQRSVHRGFLGNPAGPSALRRRQRGIPATELLGTWES